MKKIIVFVAMILVVSTLFSFTTSAASKISWKSADYGKSPDKYAYTFVAIGDQQILTFLDSGKYIKEEGPMPAEWAGKGYLNTMYQWIVDNKEEKKIEYVFGLGDITESITNASEWELAKSAASKLNGVVPYSLVRGNHDSNASFKNYFVTNNPDYTNQFEGHYGSEYLNTYRKITICGVKYLMITLACDPTDLELSWAEKIVKENPDHRTIITTHSYLSSTGVPSSSVTSLKGPNSGEKIWEKLVSKYKNIFMVISGHVCDEDGFRYAQKKGVNGNTVHQILVNPQGVDFEVEPLGMLALLHFSNDGKSISVEYYSTLKNRYSNAGTSFKIEPTGTEIIQTVATTAAATVADTTAEVTEAPSVTEPAKSGCGASVAVALVPMCVSLGVSVIASKKKNKK